MKIVHISDTHAGHGMNTERLNRLVDDVLACKEINPEHYVILHTGDLIESATDSNRRVAQTALARLTQKGYRVILCPGNHDYGNSSYVSNAAARIFLTEFASYIFPDTQQEFPVVHPLGSTHVLIGLDSNAAELRFWHGWFAEGHLGGEQLNRLNRMLDSDSMRDKKIILYLHHHPFYYGYSVMPDVGDFYFLRHLVARFTRPFRRLKDAYSLCQIMRDRVQVILFGHMHHGLDCSGESRKYGIRLALDGGSSTCNENDTDRMRYRIIDLDDLSYKMRTIMIP